MKQSQSVATMPQMLRDNVERWGGRVWMRKKEFGIWQEYTWRQGYETVKYFGLGLSSLGLQRGDVVAITGDNDPHWFWAELGAQCLGGAVAGVHSGNSPAEAKYIIDHCDATFVVAQDQEQVDKVLAIRPELPRVKKVIYWDGKGLKHYDSPDLLSFDEVVSLGRQFEMSHQGLFEDSISHGAGDDLALIQYTSGTTGLPKGAMMPYGAIYASNQAFFSLNPAGAEDEWLSFILPGWGTEQGLGLMGSLNAGLRLNFPEKQDTVTENIREIGPSLMFYASRLWENVASEIQYRMSEAAWYKRLLYRACMPVGYRAADAGFKGQRLSPPWRVLHSLCDLVFFRPLRDQLGLARLRYAYTAGSLLGPDVFRMVTAIGVDLRQLYGSGELGLSQHIRGDIKVDSVGRVNPDTIVRIMDDNEILGRGKAACVGYYKNPEAWAEKNKDGWFHNGDAGYMDDDGHLYYLDRLDYMVTLANGTRFGPQYIEARMKFSPYIKDAFVTGDGTRDFVGAIVNIHYNNVGRWAEERHIAYTTYADLSQKPQVCELIAGEIAALNGRMPDGFAVRRFVNMPKEFDPDESELTRTGKLRRGFLEQRWKDIIALVYGDAEVASMEVPVVYRDGRSGTVRAQIRVVRVGTAS